MVLERFSFGVSVGSENGLRNQTGNLAERLSTCDGRVETHSTEYPVLVVVRITLFQQLDTETDADRDEQPREVTDDNRRRYAARPLGLRDRRGGSNDKRQSRDRVGPT